MSPGDSKLRFSCPECGKDGSAPPSFAGMVVECPKCSAQFTAPGSGPQPAVTAPSVVDVRVKSSPSNATYQKTSEPDVTNKQIVAGVGAVIILLGTIVPFVDVGIFSISFIRGDGAFVAVSVAVLGALIFAKQFTWSIAPITVCVAATGYALVNPKRILYALDDLDISDIPLSEVLGPGPYVIFLGCIVAAVGLFLPFKPQQHSHRR